MKFFTRQASARIGTEQGSKDWDRRLISYQEHLNGLIKNLPAGWQQLAKMNLHDCVPFSFIQLPEKRLLLNIDLKHRQNTAPVFICSLEFKGLHKTTIGQQSMGDWWLYEEILLGQNGYIELNVLLNKSEFTISAADVKVWQNQNT